MGILIFSIVFFTMKNGISPMPISNKGRETLFSLLPERFSGKIYDLGSGWGHLVFPLAKQYSGSQVIGFENSWIPALFSYLLIHADNLEIKRCDFFKASFSDAGLVVCYLFPLGMERLKEKFEKELKKGTWILSHVFAIPGWKPLKILEVSDLYKSKVYLYRM